MIPDGPVESYLGELRRALPYPAPRLLAETREHLSEAVSIALASGRSPDEAERLAVEGYGPVRDVAAAVLQEGSPLMSPRVMRWITPVAILLIAPTAIFVAANVIEELAGSGGSEGVFGSAFDSWSSTINALIVFGPLVAVTLLVLFSLRVQIDRGARGFAATIEVKMSRATFLTTLIVASVAGAVVIYGLVENYGTWRDFHNQNWTCTTENGRQVCYQGNFPEI